MEFILSQTFVYVTVYTKGRAVTSAKIPFLRTQTARVTTKVSLNPLKVLEVLKRVGDLKQGRRIQG